MSRVATVASEEILEAEAVVQVQSTLATRLNLADFQNAVPVLRELAVVNGLPTDLKELELVVSSNPAFVRSKTWHIEAVGAGQTVHLTNLDMGLDGAHFVRLSEAEKAVVTFVLRARAMPDMALARQEVEVELLPRNQWGGLAYLPDMVAAFVQPNESYVEKLLKQAADILRQSGKSAAMNGYQGGAKRAWELTSAIWSAVGAMGIDYALPPASFELAGQKVRSPGQIADSGLATCLDLALLFCAALEQAGLNPILVFTQGHAFAGVWLKKEEFSTTVVDDVTAIRKRIKLKELLVFETTLATQRPLPAFSHAAERANLQISEEQEEKFELVVDVRRARLQRIKPLASAEATSRMADGQLEPSCVAPPQLEEAPDLPDTPDEGTDDVPGERPQDRISRWQRKLLDLSLRNNLLSFKGTKTALKLDAPNPAWLEDLLADGQSLKLLTRPDLMEGSDPRNLAIYEAREGEDVRRAHALDALGRKEVFIGLAQEEMESRLVELYRTARSTLQETGSNSLFLAIGFLSWSRDVNDSKRYRAPLILVPVTLERRSIRSGFSLKLHDDEPRFNPTLIEMLRQDFNLELGILDGEMPKDEHGLDVPGIWKKVSTAVKDIKGWEVVEDVVLSTFSFAKYLMWKDLAERTEQLKLNPVVRHLIETPREHYASTVSFPNVKSLDTELPPQEMFCPLPADSSQLAAVVAASRGKDFVLIGPPGTGKSQTISNLIAQCLAERKRVLFVSEKMAALDVVYRRLREIGLGEFCLELHSNKASKAEVLAQLKRSWEASGTVDPQEWKFQAERLGALRAELNRYVERLHHRHPNGLSAYEAIGRMVLNTEAPQLALSWPLATQHDARTLATLRETAERLDLNAQAVGGSLTSSPLAHIVHIDWSPSWQARLLETATQLIPAANEIAASAGAFTTAAGLPSTELNRNARRAMAVLARILPHGSGRDWRFALRPDARVIVEAMQRGTGLVMAYRKLRDSIPGAWSDNTSSALKNGVLLVTRARLLRAELQAAWDASVCKELSQAIELVKQHHECRRALSLQYSDSVGQLDVVQLHRQWQGAAKAIWPLNWFRKKALAKTLRSVAAPGGELDMQGDVGRLVKLKNLHADIKSRQKLEVTAENVWKGFKTDMEAARSMLGYQRALANILTAQDWDDVGLEPVAKGQCGTDHAANLGRMRELRTIDAELKKLSHLAHETQGLWNSLQTDLAAALAAIEFQSAVTASLDERPWRDEGLEPVAQERCGKTVATTLQSMREMRRLSGELEQLAEFAGKTGGLWAGTKTNVEEVALAVKFHAPLAAILGALVTTPEELMAFKEPLVHLLGESNMLLNAGGAICVAGQRYLAAWGSFEAALGDFIQASGQEQTNQAMPGDESAQGIAQRAHQVLQLSGKVNAWCAWQKVRSLASTQRLAPLIAAIEQGVVAPGAAKDVFQTAYCRWWLNAVVDADDVLRTFVSAEHEKRIRDFKELDDHFTGLTHKWVRAQLCADLPAQDSVSRNSEWGVLRHEMQKKKNHLPLRELMKCSPGAITKLAPCLLMSPLSIAQYLAADSATFDIVIFDEASQIPVWDAIGAIARAKQVVMVGDPKQLPPTNFFNRAESDADDADVEADLESILDECIGANLPTLNLSWHYRSRHESLIAFSNHRYYGGGLVTFPSPVTQDTAVSFHHIKHGVYEKGGARTNKPEAMALVAHLVAKLKSPDFRASGSTAGVVTFNSEQQRLIEDLLDEERRKDPTLEAYFDDSLLEPVFIKNLESVQGDERDVMYFSLTYGPNISGTVSMNFGPMNKQGGERRLNVAITRARQELCVFSSLLPEQMDLSRTQALGVRDLKHFMEFAQRGARALGEAIAGSLGEFESPFEEAVARALTAKGWVLHPQVGVSSFRIDLGVVDEDAPGSYLAGVECDGATYHSSATARDRDKLREQVLRGLGWNIVRIWSTDWWVDAAGTAEKIDGQLRAILSARRVERSVIAQEEAAKAAAQAVANAAVNDLPARPGIPETAIPALSAQAVDGAEDALPMRQFSRHENAAPALEDDKLAGHEANAAVFFDASYDSALLGMIDDIVQRESPVLDEVLARRIARAHGWQRTGVRIQQRVVQLAMREHRHTKEDAATFFWHRTAPDALNISFRRPVNGKVRSVEEISMAELRQLAREFSTDTMSEFAGVAAMAKEIGLSRLSATNKDRLLTAWREVCQPRML